MIRGDTRVDTLLTFMSISKLWHCLVCEFHIQLRCPFFVWVINAGLEQISQSLQLILTVLLGPPANVLQVETYADGGTADTTRVFFACGRGTHSVAGTRVCCHQTCDQRQDHHHQRFDIPIKDALIRLAERRVAFTSRTLKLSGVGWLAWQRTRSDAWALLQRLLTAQ